MSDLTPPPFVPCGTSTGEGVQVPTPAPMPETPMAAFRRFCQNSCGIVPCDDGMYALAEDVLKLQRELTAKDREIERRKAQLDMWTSAAMHGNAAIAQQTARTETAEAELAQLRAEVERLNKPWTVSIIAPTQLDPFNRFPCEVYDIGHSDRHLVVMCDQLRAHVAELSKKPICSCCAGTGKPVSGLLCICGGVGTQEAELQGFRESHYRLEQRMAELEADKERLKAHVVNLLPYANMLLHGKQPIAAYADVLPYVIADSTAAVDAARKKGAT